MGACTVARPGGRTDPTRRQTIAVVDDQQDFLGLATDILEPEGYAVVTCQRAEDAERWLRETKPDLLIVDIRMPGVPAWHVFDRVRADPELARIPCIICTAARDELRAREPWLHQHGYGILDKPFDLDELLQKVAAQLRPRAP